MVPHPNLGSLDSESESLILEKSKIQEIFYEGYFYDVTDFISRHPGGNVIKFYTEEGQDATAAIQQFHHRSMKQVNLILKSFKKRPATDQDFTCMSPEKLKRHQSLSNDYTNLFLELQKEGLFKPSKIHAGLRIFQWAMFAIVGFYLLTVQNIWVNILGAVILGLWTGHGGYVSHESGHNSLTGIVKVDKFLESMFFGISFGMPAQWWNKMHNKHHAMPQRMHHDIDLHTTPLMAFNSKVIKDSKEGKSFFIQNQSWLFLLIDTFLIGHIWRLYLAPKNAIKNRNFCDIFMMSVHWMLIIKFSTLPLYFITIWVGGNYLLGNFTLGHSYLPIADDHTHWIEYGLMHTADVEPNIVTDWWMGYLNFQIEHHLFPTMPQFRNHLVKDRVKALAKKYDLPYHSYSFWEAWGLALKNMYNVSKELKMAH